MPRRLETGDASYRPARLSAAKDRTKRLLALHRRHKRPYWVDFSGLNLLLLPNVFCPSLGEGSQMLAENMGLAIGETVLELGTGSGALAILAANRRRKVVATDISPIAVKCASLNSDRLKTNGLVDIRQGDLFSPVSPTERFDTVMFNPPFMEGKPRSTLEMAIYDDHYRTLTRFIERVPLYLTPHGRVLLAFSTCGDFPYLGHLIRQSSLSFKTRKRTTHRAIDFVLFEGTKR